MRFSMIQRADVHERFAPTAFDSQIGKTIPVKAPGGSTSGTVVAAQVSPDGKHAELTIEIGDENLVARTMAKAGVEALGKKLLRGTGPT